MIIGSSITRILDVDAETFEVDLEYSDGFRGTVDLKFLFEHPADKPMVLELVRGNLFGRCFVEAGALAWPNGYELCPDAIRQWVTEAGTKVA